MAKQPTLTPEQKQGVLEANKAGGEAGARKYLQGQGLLEAPEPVSAPVQQQTDQMAFDPAQSPLEAKPVEPVQEPVQPIIDEKEQEVAEPVQPQEVKVEDVQAGKQLQGGESIVSKEDTAGIIAPENAGESKTDKTLDLMKSMSKDELSSELLKLAKSDPSAYNKMLKDGRFKSIVDSRILGVGLTGGEVKEQMGIEPTEKELLDIEATKKEQERVENSEYLQGLQGLLDSDATNDEIRAYAKENQELSNRNKTFVTGMITGAFKRREVAKYTQKYGAMTNEQLRNAVNSGEITEGSKMWNNLTPEQRASYDIYTKEAEAVDPVKGEALELKTENVLSMNTFMEKLNDIFSSNTAKTYRDAMQSEKMKGFNVNINDKKQAVNDIDDELDDIEDDVISEFPGATRTFISAVVANRSKAIYKKRRVAVSAYNSALAEYQDAKDELSMELDIAEIEDTNNKEKYMLALNMYETRRGEMREDEIIAFQEESKIRAEDISKQFQLDLIDYKNKIDSDNLSKDGKWIERDDGLYFAKNDGTADKVFGTSSIKRNDDGTSSVTGLDENGNPFNMNYDVQGNRVTFSSTVGGDDFSSLSAQYPGEAWANNNNPAGLTFTPTALKRMQDLGINVVNGSDRPANEGGSYFKFASIQDGLMGYDNLWNQSWYQGNTVQGALNTWGTGDLSNFVDDIDRFNSIKNKKVSDISDSDLQFIQVAQLKKESPGLVNEMNSRGWIKGNKWNIPTKSDYKESENAHKELDKEKFNQYTKIIAPFRANPTVKGFEASSIETKNLLTSLSTKNGVGDMAAIFQFMKTLDPSSVVKETEFEAAANTAGVVTGTKNIFNKMLNGEILDNEKQRIQFQKIAEQFILNRADGYDREYDNTMKIMSLQNIDGAYMPERASDEIRKLLNTKGSNGNDFMGDFYSKEGESEISNFLNFID